MPGEDSSAFCGAMTAAFSADFFAIAAQIMRRILVENARRKQRLKYGGDRLRIEFHPELTAESGASDDLLALDERQMRDVRGRRIAMVFQDPMASLNPVMTVGQQIDDMLMRHMGLSQGAARKRTIELLAQVGIQLKVNTLPPGQMFPRIARGETSFYGLSWGVPTYDAMYTLRGIMMSRAKVGGSSWNGGGYSNAAFDASTVGPALCSRAIDGANTSKLPKRRLRTTAAFR